MKHLDQILRISVANRGSHPLLQPTSQRCNHRQSQDLVVEVCLLYHSRKRLKGNSKVSHEIDCRMSHEANNCLTSSGSICKCFAAQTQQYPQELAE